MYPKTGLLKSYNIAAGLGNREPVTTDKRAELKKYINRLSITAVCDSSGFL